MLRKVVPFVLFLAYGFAIFGCGSSSSDPSTYYKDADGDSYSDGATTTTETTGYYLAESLTAISGDCDDDDAAINPGATEVCDGVDNDCNSEIDEGVTTAYYADVDGDTYGDPADILDVCTQPLDYVTDNTDCDDDDATTNPGATEVCDGIDNDCNPATVDGVGEAWLGDLCDGADTDLCEEGNLECVAGAQECSDTSGDILDSCDGIDNDCNPATADGADEAWLGELCDGTDTDLCEEGNLECVAGAQECSDTSGDILDICDGIDNDCNVATADGADEAWLDELCDGTDTDLCEEGTFSCAAGTQTCSDNSGDNLEICNGLDDDCDGPVDEGNPGGGAACSTGLQGVCEPGTWVCSSGTLSCEEDVFPSAETCNALDDDCDGSVDEGVTTAYYADVDGDTYGDPADILDVCTQPPNYVTDNTDCDDTDAAVNPGATEICGDSIDNDCTGGDMSCPIVITELVELDPIDTTDSADVAVYGDYLYYAGWEGAGVSFGIVDFSDPTNPVILSTMDVGWAYGVAFDGRYAYVETDGGGAGIFEFGTVGVIDCLDPENPVEVTANDLGYSSAYDMELSGDYLYNFSANIIGVYDVSTPTAITHVANLSTSDAEFGRVVDNYLYYGDGVDGLAIFDVSDPASLTDLTTPVGNLAITGNGKGATASGTTAFIASDGGAGTFYINSVDVSDPTTPVLISSVETLSFIDYEMRILGNYLLAVGDLDFVVIDISDPSNMTVVDSVAMPSQNGWGFDISGNYAIVGDDTLLRIIQLY